MEKAARRWVRKPIKKTGPNGPTPLPAKRSAFRRVRDGAPGSTPGAGARQGQRATTLPTPIGGGTRRNPKSQSRPHHVSTFQNDGDGLKGGMQGNEKPPREVSASPCRRSGGGGSGNPRPTTANPLPHAATLCALSVRSPAPNGGVSRLRPAGGG